MSETIIELRQRNELTQVNSNGDYLVTLGEPLLIEKNNEIVMKQCYIDTLAKSQGKIVIPSDVNEISIKFGYYLVDQDSTQQVCNDYKTYFGSPNSSISQPDGKSYYLASRDPGGSAHGAGNLEMITFNNIQLRDRTNNGRFSRDTFIKLYLQYKNAKGDIVDWNFQIRTKDYENACNDEGAKNNEIYTFNSTNVHYHKTPNFGIPCQKNAFGNNITLRYNPNKCNSEGDGSKNAHNGKVDFISVGGISAIVGAHTYNPWIFEKKISVEPGRSYLPDELTKLLTRQLTSSLDKDGTVPQGSYVNGDMLQTIEELKLLGVSKDSNPIEAGYNFWVANDASEAFQMKAGTKNYLMGSSNFDIGYDAESGLISIDKMHCPIYSDNLECILPVEVNSRKFVLNKWSGIYLISCTPDILTQELNLPPSIYPKMDSVTKSLGAINESQFTTINFEDGISTTGQSIFLDAFVSKNSDPIKGNTFDVASGYVGQGSGQTTTHGILSSQITNIKGVAPVIDIASDSDSNAVPYYQIEISSNFSYQKLSNSSNSKRISAIVNKYYSQDNYTMGDSSMASVYIHKEDEPILIKQFGIRILDPDGYPVDPDTVLQDDNTVFLSVMKN